MCLSVALLVASGALTFSLNYDLHYSLHVTSLLAEHHASYLIPVSSYKAWVTWEM